MFNLRTTVSTILRWPARAITAILIVMIRLYQVTLSPLLGPACRFEPTCSRYMVESLRKYGAGEGPRTRPAPNLTLPPLGSGWV